MMKNLVILLLIFVPLSIFGQTNQLGPWSSLVDIIWPDPKGDGVLYAHWQTLIQKSTDWGATWQPVDMNPWYELDGLAFTYGMPASVIAHGTYHTNQPYQTYQNCGVGYPEKRILWENRWLVRLSTLPDYGGKVVAIATNNIYISEDNGRNWTTANIYPSEIMGKVIAGAFDFMNNWCWLSATGHTYLANLNINILTGKEFTMVGGSEPLLGVKRIEIPWSQGPIYAFREDNVYRGSLQGTGFMPILPYNLLMDYANALIFFDPYHRNSMIFVGPDDCSCTRYDFYYSSDGGDSWDYIPIVEEITNDEPPEGNDGTPPLVIWTKEGPVIRYGDNWYRDDDGDFTRLPLPSRAPNLRSLTIDKEQPDLLYVIQDNRGLRISVDGGNAWSDFNYIKYDVPYWEFTSGQILAHPRTPSALFVSVKKSLYKYKHFDKEFTLLHRQPTDNPLYISHPDSTNVFFALAPVGDPTCQLYKVNPLQRKWEVHYRNATNWDELYISPYDSKTMIALDRDNGIIYVSKDYGVKWDPGYQVPSAQRKCDTPVASVLFDPMDPNHIYVLSERDCDYKSWPGIWKLMETTNGGDRWFEINDLPNDAFPVWGIAPTNPDHIILASRFGIYLSADKGRNWTSIYSFPNETVIKEMTFSSAYSDVVYLITEEGGVTTVKLPPVSSIEPDFAKVNLNVFPNPASTKVRFALSNPNLIKQLDIVDLQGRLVWSGSTDEIWNLEDTNGKRAASGVYLISAKGLEPQRLIVLK